MYRESRQSRGSERRSQRSSEKKPRSYAQPDEREIRLSMKEDHMKMLFERVNLPYSIPDYSSHNYWNMRYQKEENLTFDWLQNLDSLKLFFERKFGQDPDIEILQLGCGNSTLAEGLYNMGYRNISNIDFSYVVVKDMVRRYSDYKEMDFEVMDVTDIKYEEECFDFVIDKAAFDCVLCSDDSVEKAFDTLDGIYRVLKPGGEYIMISDGHPESRLAFLKNPNFKWVVSVFELDKTRDNIDNQSKDYIYICSK